MLHNDIYYPENHNHLMMSFANHTSPSSTRRNWRILYYFLTSFSHYSQSFPRNYFPNYIIEINSGVYFVFRSYAVQIQQLMGNYFEQIEIISKLNFIITIPLYHRMYYKLLLLMTSMFSDAIGILGIR